MAGCACARGQRAGAALVGLLAVVGAVVGLAAGVPCSHSFDGGKTTFNLTGLSVPWGSSDMVTGGFSVFAYWFNPCGLTCTESFGDHPSPVCIVHGDGAFTEPGGLLHTWEWAPLQGGGARVGISASVTHGWLTSECDPSGQPGRMTTQMDFVCDPAAPLRPHNVSVARDSQCHFTATIPTPAACPVSAG